MPGEGDRSVAGDAILFKSMPKDIAGQAFRQSVVRSFGRGESIFIQGEQAACVYVVLEGWVKPENPSRSFARLREKGVITGNNNMAIADVKVLKEDIEEDPAAAWSRAL